MTARLFGAIQFLTALPIRRDTAPIGLCAAWFPFVGAVLGGLSGVVFTTAEHVLTRPIAALISIAFLLAATGCLHEDGLADVADAVRSGRSREKISSILKDSRIGTYGAAALIVSLLLRWQSLAECRVNAVAGLAAALALSRSSLVILAAITPATGDGLGQAFAHEISRPALWITVAQAIAIAFLAGWVRGSAMLLLTAAVLFLARAWFMRRLSGITGDCLGATCQAVETVNLLVLAWQSST